MKTTGHRTRGVFERYNITDQGGTQEAGRIAEEFLAREYRYQFGTNHVTTKGKPN
jgi:hypothetical protein